MIPFTCSNSKMEQFISPCEKVDSAVAVGDVVTSAVSIQ